MGGSDEKTSGTTKTCFVVSPIGDDNSEPRIHADWVLNGIIRKSMEEHKDFKVVRADEVSAPGLIDRQILRYLYESDLVIADLSFKNPNVMYEVGIRHMLQKPIIHMHNITEKLPFDIILQRSIPFSLITYQSVNKAVSDLSAAIKAVLDPSFEIDNPVVAALGRLRIEMSATPDEKVLLKSIQSLEARVAQLEAPEMRKIMVQEIERDIRSGRPTPISADDLRSILIKIVSPPQASTNISDTNK